jgi:nitric-oxide synthase
MDAETLPASTLDHCAPTATAGTAPTCLASVPARRSSSAADPKEAEEFLRQFHTEQPEQPVPFTARLRQVLIEIDNTGAYRHTSEELAFGARVAWRNSSRCIGRLYWNSLRVMDRRDAKTPEAIYRCLCEHLRQATNAGRSRPVISIFAPDTPERAAPRVWNDQLIRYAGYRRQDGTILGDPALVDFTEAVCRLGWSAPQGLFDVLPLVIETADDKPQIFELPSDLILEVPIIHPEHPQIADLALRWYAVPAISNMRLRIGGIDYPLAPFNGWYMGSEIGARNLVDEDRFDLLLTVAECLGLDISSEITLWRDRALVELNVAVLHSFTTAGVTISNHHTESRHFLTHLAREGRNGRTVSADWSWIVPPISGGITPVFHRYYDDTEQRPNFYLDDQARARSRGQCPYAH